MKISCIIKINKKLKTERTIKNGQPRKKNDNLGYTRRNIKQSKNITYYPQTNIHNANKTTGVKYESNIVFMRKS
jgi:hypothetical protein